MQVFMRADSLCFYGRIAELRDFWASLSGPMAAGVTVKEYLRWQLEGGL